MLKYRAGDTEIDLASGIIRRKGREERVRAQTLRVLDFLIVNRDRPVTRDEIIENLWDSASVSENVVAQSINDLRKALGDNSRTPVYIRTIPKSGYQFIAAVEPVQAPVQAAPRRKIPIRIRMLLLVVVAGLMKPSAPKAPLKATVYLRETAWWRFAESAGPAVQDSAGNGAAGRMFGGATRGPGPPGLGNEGSALVFDGVRCGVQGRAGDAVFPSGPRSRTVSAWFLARSTNGDTTPIFHYWRPDLGVTGTSLAVSLRLDGKIMQNSAYAAAGLLSRRRFDDAQWHQVVATWREQADNPGQCDGRLTLDGIEEASGSLNCGAILPGGVWTVGGFPDTGTSFRGSIADVRILNGALTPLQASALYRCSAGLADADVAGQSSYFIPIYPDGFEPLAGMRWGIRNPGRDFGGVQFARAQNGCAIGSIEGTDAGQDLRISADITVPADIAGEVSAAGPYFRSRSAAPGDGIIGGTSAGYAALLHSTGLVSVMRLNPRAVVAFANIGGFDSRMSHHLEVVAVGQNLQASLDDRILEFDEAGRKTRTVSLPPRWDGPPKLGHNDGAAGIAFMTGNRGKVGGQTAAGIKVGRATSLLTP